MTARAWPTCERLCGMRILISNDDGIYSPGIVALAEVARQFGEVRIVAPDVEQSSMGHAITASRPLGYRRTPIGDFEAYRVNGTPADCVALGVDHWGGADLVLSGINLGTNLGTAIWHSGTVAAAKQATILGLQGIAFSTAVDDHEPEFGRLWPHIEEVLRLLMQKSSPRLVNVNLPASPRGIQWTRQSVRRYDAKMVGIKDPMGRDRYWFTVTPIGQADPGTDRWAFEHGWVSITPLNLDLTDHEALHQRFSC